MPSRRGHRGKGNRVLGRGRIDPTRQATYWPVTNVVPGKRSCLACSTLRGIGPDGLCQYCRKAALTPDPDHGTWSRYCDGCRCPACYDVGAGYRLIRRERLKYVLGNL